MQGEVVVSEGLGGADLLAHEEHGRAGREHAHAEGEAAARLGVAPRGAHERRAVHRHHHRARRLLAVAGLVVGFGVGDLALAAARESAAHGPHGERAVTAGARRAQQPRVLAAPLSVAHQVMAEVRVPDGVEAEPAFVRRLREGGPAAVVLGDDEGARLDHPHRAGELAQQLLAERIGAIHRPPVGMEAVVPVDGLHEVHAHAVDVELFEQRGHAAREHPADLLLPVAGRPPAGAVVHVAAVGARVVARPAFVPVIDVPLR